MYVALKALVLLLLVFSLGGCESAHFYRQAIAGQTHLLWQREAVPELLASDIDPQLRHQLELSVDVLAYAKESGLETGGAYTSYVETGRPYVVWNVFAADPLELALKTSCFPVAGCVSYRGYFREEDARQYAAKMREQGLDVYVGGVGAYSTLGWFKDPLLDTFLFRSEEHLAALLFHELAHQLVYVKGDTRFNESLATAVEQYVLERYLAEKGRADDFVKYQASRARRDQVISLVSKVRAELRGVYASDLSREEKLKRKSVIIGELVVRYERLAESWAEGNEYLYWMRSPINNAKLETVADYHEWVPVMEGQLEQRGFDGFVEWLQALAKLDSDERTQRLRDLSE
ncbi:MAG: aminopeptidase [Pseudomonadales bacterium]|jgi:predicted aminopeptidase|nr:aminopeptidase [Pseudomonadales bacterium]